MMKISVIGTRMVGQAIAGKLTELGQSVYMGTRNAAETLARTEPHPMTGTSFSHWHQEHPEVIVVDLGELPGDSDLFINASRGKASLEALKSVGSNKLAGKTVLDIANPLDFLKGFTSFPVCKQYRLPGGDAPKRVSGIQDR